MVEVIGAVGAIAVLWGASDLVIDDEKPSKAWHRLGAGVLLIGLSAGLKYLGVDF